MRNLHDLCLCGRAFLPGLSNLEPWNDPVYVMTCMVPEHSVEDYARTGGGETEKRESIYQISRGTGNTVVCHITPPSCLAANGKRHDEKNPK